MQLFTRIFPCLTTHDIFQGTFRVILNPSYRSTDSNSRGEAHIVRGVINEVIFDKVLQPSKNKSIIISSLHRFTKITFRQQHGIIEGSSMGLLKEGLFHRPPVPQYRNEERDL